MAEGCCCMRPQKGIYITSGILVVGWTLQFILSGERFISAVMWSHDNPQHREAEGGTTVGVSGLLLIVDSAQALLSALVLSAAFFRDLNKLQPWLILSSITLVFYVPLSIAACLLQITQEVEFVLSWLFIVITLYTMWLVHEFKKELANSSLERLL